jgi:sulfur-carrier protein
MRISVEIAFSFKHDLGEAYRELELPAGATVIDAIHVLADRYEVFRSRVLDDAGAVRRHISALVNGRNVQSQAGFDTPLDDGDRLSILPPAGGG